MKEINLMPDNHFLVEAAKNGDMLAMNQLVQLWHKRIFNFAYKYFGDYDQASEATQKTFISMSKNLKSLKDVKVFKSWLYRIASNYCHEEVRKNQKRWVFPFMKVQNQKDLSSIDSTLAIGREANPEKRLGNTELKELLQKALSTLPENQRLVVIMKEYEGLKLREIAEALAISENTVKSRLYYALGSLKKLLEEWNVNKETVHYEL